MNRARHTIIVCLVVLVTALSAAGPVLGSDPDDGSVILPDGRVLPAAPPELNVPTVHGEMLAENPVAPPVEPGTTPDALAGADGAGVGTINTLGAAGAVTVAGPGGVLPNGLRKEVFGFLPYWMLGEIGSMRYDLVSTIAFFGVPASADGTLARGSLWDTWNSAAMTSVINNAHARGVKVVLTVTMMAWAGDYSAQSSLLNSASARSRLVGEIAAAVKNRNADGVNLDFEPVPTTLRSQYTAFVRQLKAGLINGGARSYLTVSTMAGAATWATGYDVAGLTAAGAADAIMVMAYDFSWSGSARAGGVAPMESPYIFDVTDALADHLKVVPASKIIWGVPYYGRSWPTQTDQLNSLTRPPTATSYSRAWGYSAGKESAAQYGRRWDAVGEVPWFAYWDSANATVRQAYYDDPTSLRAKYALVQRNGVAGIGIWSLLMDAGTNDLWNVIYDRFVKLTSRLAGADRYATAAAVSAASFNAGAPVAFVATGANFPDALSAGPAAAMGNGPVLLTARDTLPAATAAELARLRPARIWVLGQGAVVSDAVVAALRAYSGDVRRLAGADRYATAAAISGAYFNPGVGVAYVATGSNFPDALAGGAAAARQGGPVLLSRRDAIPSATAAELARLRPTRIVVLGGSSVLSDGLLAALRAYSPDVSRIAGADRYATAAAISAAGFAADGPASVYLATGSNFPDGLAAAPVAGRNNAPLLLTAPGYLPAVTAAELRRLNPSQVIVLGSSGAVSDAVLAQIRALWP